MALAASRREGEKKSILEFILRLSKKNNTRGLISKALPPIPDN